MTDLSSANVTSVVVPPYPRLSPDLNALANTVFQQRGEVTSAPHEGFTLVVNYPNDGHKPREERLYPGMLFDAGCKFITAIQEDAMLSTVVSGRPTFKQVWDSDAAFRKALLAQKDPSDFGKWALRKPFNYVIPSLFIPCVARSFYEQFSSMVGKPAGGLRVLDPCSGWGDRLTGAFCSNVVSEYVACDPNSALYEGYGVIKQLCGSRNPNMRATMIMQGFEIAAPLLADGTFDVVFTSPPFFDYEVYSAQNPKYTDWEKEFYEPLVQHALRLVHANGVVAFHIDDTTAGKVPHAIRSRVVEKFAVDVGFGKRKISVWVLRAGLQTQSDQKRPRSPPSEPAE
jgi:hypothetical protein